MTKFKTHLMIIVACTLSCVAAYMCTRSIDREIQRKVQSMEATRRLDSMLMFKRNSISLGIDSILLTDPTAGRIWQVPKHHHHHADTLEYKLSCSDTLDWTRHSVRTFIADDDTIRIFGLDSVQVIKPNHTVTFQQ